MVYEEVVAVFGARVSRSVVPPLWVDLSLSVSRTNKPNEFVLIKTERLSRFVLATVTECLLRM